MERNFYIYSITNNINGKRYIGKASKNSDRWNKHKLRAKHIINDPLCKHDSKNCPFFHSKPSLINKVMTKHGIENFSFEILEEIDCENLAYELEIWWIDYYGTFVKNDKGYNLSIGGKGGTSGYKMSDEQRAKMSKRMSGTNSPMYGRKGILAPAYGRKRTEEEKLRISLAQRGENSPHYGKRGAGTPHYGHKHSKETRANLQKFSTDFLGQVFYRYITENISLRKLALEANVTRANLALILKRKGEARTDVFEKYKNIMEKSILKYEKSRRPKRK